MSDISDKFAEKELRGLRSRAYSAAAKARHFNNQDEADVLRDLAGRDERLLAALLLDLAATAARGQHSRELKHEERQRAVRIFSKIKMFLRDQEVAARNYAAEHAEPLLETPAEPAQDYSPGNYGYAEEHPEDGPRLIERPA